MLASLTPCLRHRLATDKPASFSFKILTICSSEKRLRFITLVVVVGHSELQTGLSPWGKVTINGLLERPPINYTMLRRDIILPISYTMRCARW
jgi:hypothetical protein